MKRLAYLFALLFALTLTRLGGCSQVAEAVVQPGQVGTLRSLDDEGPRLTYAVLRNARGLFRTICARGQHVLPASSHPSHQHSASRSPMLWRCRCLTLQHRFDGRRRRESSPFPTAASRHYYIIALRRLLC